MLNVKPDPHACGHWPRPATLDLGFYNISDPRRNGLAVMLRHDANVLDQRRREPHRDMCGKTRGGRAHHASDGPLVDLVTINLSHVLNSSRHRSSRYRVRRLTPASTIETGRHFPWVPDRQSATRKTTGNRAGEGSGKPPGTSPTINHSAEPWPVYS